MIWIKSGHVLYLSKIVMMKCKETINPLVCSSRCLITSSFQINFTFALNFISIGPSFILPCCCLGSTSFPTSRFSAVKVIRHPVRALSNASFRLFCPCNRSASSVSFLKTRPCILDRAVCIRWHSVNVECSVVGAFM